MAREGRISLPAFDLSTGSVVIKGYDKGKYICTLYINNAGVAVYKQQKQLCDKGWKTFFETIKKGISKD